MTNHVALLRQYTAGRALLEGRQLHSKLTDLGFDQDACLGNLLIRFYGSCGCPDQSFRAFHAIASGRNVFTWNMALAACARHDSGLSRARIIFDRFPQRSTATWNTILAAVAGSGNLFGAQDLFLEIPEHDVFSWTTMLTLLTGRGDLRQVMSFFDSMPERGIVAWNVVVQEQAQNGQLDRALQIFAKMPEHSPISWNSIITAFAKDGRPDLSRNIFNSLPARNSVSWGALISAFAGNENLSEAWQAYSKMPHCDVYAGNVVLQGMAENDQDMGWNLLHEFFFDGMRHRDIVSWNAMISATAQRGDPLVADLFFDRMPQHDSISWASKLWARVESGNPSAAKEVFDQSPHCGIDSWTALVTAYAQAGHLSRATRFFHAMPERNQIVWNLLIQAHAHSGDLPNARNFFERMPCHSTASHNAMIAGAADQLELAESIFAQMHQRNVVSWNCLIVSFVHSDRLDRALEAFHRVASRDAVTWTVLVTGHCQLGSVRDAHATFRAMPYRTVVAWNSLLQGYVSCGLLDDASSVFDRMPSRNLVSWTGIISGYAHLGFVDRAKETFDRAPERDVISWNALITAFAMNGYSIAALKLLPEMDLDGVEPNAVTYMVLIDACSTLASLSDSKSVHACVRDDSGLLDGDVLLQTSLVNMYGKCAHLGAARDMFDDIPDKELALWNTMLCVYAQNGHTDQAMELFQLLLVDGVEPDRITYIGILSSWSHAGVVWYEFLRSLEPDFGVTPAVDFYVCVIDILSRTGQLELAEDLIFGMPYEPNEVAWTSLLGACRSYVDRDRAARVAERMNLYNPATYLLLSNVHSLPP